MSENNQGKQNKGQNERNNVDNKRRYHTPGFVHYGDITSLVKNQEGVGGDGGGGFADDTLS